MGSRKEDEERESKGRYIAGGGRASMKKIGKTIIKGVRVRSGADAAGALVKLVKEKLGKDYPAFLDTPFGKALAPMLIPIMIILFVDNFGEENPQLRKLRKVSEYALEGTAGGLVEIMNKLVPMFGNLAAMSAVLDDEDD